MFLVLAVAAPVLIPASAQANGWSEDRNGGQRGGAGFWRGSAGGGMSKYPTTAEISQALYGTDPEPYDAWAEDEHPEEVQAG